MIKKTTKKVNKKEVLSDGTVLEIVNEETISIPIEEFDFTMLGLSNDLRNSDKNANSKK